MHFASTPPTTHSPARWAYRVNVTHSAADSTAASGTGVIRQLSRCHAQASSVHTNKRPVQANAGNESHFVSQPNDQANTRGASGESRNKSPGHQAGSQ